MTRVDAMARHEAGSPILVSWRDAMLAALLASLGHGRWWLAALASFLVRGGLIALLPAIVVLPTPAELAVNLDPSLTGDAPGALTPALVGLLVRLLVVATIVLLATTALGVRLEDELVTAATADEELAALVGTSRIRHAPLGRAVAARLLAHLPTLGAVLVGGRALADAAYAELVAPSSVGPLVARIVSDAPLGAVLIVMAWLVGETWGGLAVRRLAAGDPVGRAMASGLLRVVRPTGLATLALTSIAVLLPAVALWLATSRAFDRLWPLVVDRADPWLVGVALGLLVASWGAGLWLLAIGLAFRSAAWTAEGLRSS